LKRHIHDHRREMTLDQIKSGETVLVEHIKGGWGCSQRLNQMGIHAGDPVKIKRNAVLGGPILIQVHGSEVALGRGMARHVIVSSAESNKETNTFPVSTEG
jgi:ferrous iron transport protein A